MDIQYLGGSSFELVVNKTTFVIDPLGADLTNKKSKLDKSIVIKTNHKETADVGSSDVEFLIDTPGEYEIHGMAVRGIQTKSMLDVHDSDGSTNTAYSLRANDISVGVLGHPAFPLSDEVYEQLGTLDVLIVPVGGGGYTLDADQASKVIKEVEPKLIIPCHYEDSSVNYPTPQDSLSKFLEEIGMEPKKEEKLKLKATSLPEITELVVLSAQ